MQRLGNNHDGYHGETIDIVAVLRDLARLIASAIASAAVLVPQAETPAGDFTAALTAAGHSWMLLTGTLALGAGTATAAPFSAPLGLVAAPPAAGRLR